MPITQIQMDLIGESGVNPRLGRIVCTDDYGDVTGLNFLKPQEAMGYSFLPTDFIAVTYSGGFGWFQPEIAAGAITLVPMPAPGASGGTIVSGNFTVFDGTAGLLEDLGYSPSNAAKTKVVMANGATVSGNLAVFTDTAGTVDDNLAALNTVTNASATPGTVRSLTGQLTSSATTMTSGNLVGARGAVTCVGASGGFLYGAQGKVIASGTLSGSAWTAGVFGQLDISAATINAGQCAAIWGDYGTSSGTMTDTTGCRGVSMTNTTAAILNAQDYRYGNATYLLELAGSGGTLNYYAAAGTSAGSAGDATHCAAQQVLKVQINSVAAYIPVFTQNT